MDILLLQLYRIYLIIHLIACRGLLFPYIVNARRQLQGIARPIRTYGQLTGLLRQIRIRINLVKGAFQTIAAVLFRTFCLRRLLAQRKRQLRTVDRIGGILL